MEELKCELQGVVHWLKQRRKPKFEFENRIDFYTFDTEYSPSKKILQRIEFLDSGDVSRTTRYTYAANGNLLRTIGRDLSGKELSSSDFEHLPGKVICTTRDPSGSITRQNIDEYDGNRLVVVGTYGGDGAPRRIKRFEYENEKVRRAESRYFGFTGELAEVWTENYDSSERLIETYGLKPDGSPLGDGRYVHEYDAMGREFRVWSFNDFDEGGEASSVTQYEYTVDEHGNWTECRQFFRSRSDSHWSRTLTTRNLIYYS
jgi:hypothetical protein